MDVRSILWNRTEGRPRAGWRLVLAFVLVAVPTVLVGVVLAAALRVGPDASALLLLGLNTVALTAGTGLGVAVAARVLDRRPLVEYGLHVDRDWLVDLGVGFLLGGALMTLVFAAELALGWIRVTGVFVASGGSFASTFAIELLLFAAVAIYEEVLARGYLLRNVAEGLRGFGRHAALAAAVGCSALVFAVAHAANPGARLASVLGVLVAGGFLAVAYVETGELALPIGAHLSWNLFQGAVYGFPVSGFALPATVVATRSDGPVAFTGGQFGPEAGLLGAAAALLGAGASVAWARLAGRDRIDVAPTLRRER